MFSPVKILHVTNNQSLLKLNIHVSMLTSPNMVLPMISYKKFVVQQCIKVDITECCIPMS